MSILNKKRSASTAGKEIHKRISALQAELDHNVSDWPRYQEPINNLTFDIFKKCQEYELKKPSEVELKLLKAEFIGEFGYFVRKGSLNRWVMDRPYGYAGDHHVLDKIYGNNVETVGFEACMDRYFLDSPASIATRNRKDDFVRIINNFIAQYSEKRIRILNLASGPCRDIKELLASSRLDKFIEIHCIDHDSRALEYGKNVLGEIPQDGVEIKYFQKNAFRMALNKNIGKYLPQSYDLIFSTGLIDYFNDSLALGLIKNIKQCLRPSGKMVISNYTEAERNPSRIFMEWGVDWNIVYRSAEQYLNIFKEAGFIDSCVKLEYERQGLMQYCHASNAI